MGRNVKSRGFPNRATLETRHIWVATGHSATNRVVGVFCPRIRASNSPEAEIETLEYLIGIDATGHLTIESLNVKLNLFSVLA